MVTCSEWYKGIHQYINDKWKNLKLDKKGVSKHQEQNSGKHVRRVSFKGVGEDLLSKMM